jgi:uncharacterized protein (DUF1015 family)
MADVRAFRGIRYNAARFGSDLTDVVCPPYDVISPSEQDALYRRNPANFVRLELTAAAPDEPAEERYARAGREFRAWLADGTLVKESTPVLYAYAQSFSLDGSQFERRGVVALLRIEDWETRTVRPHERTLSGPKQDRLNLMHACRANFSPIWGLYGDSSTATARVWEGVTGVAPTARAADGEGVRHELWAVTDPNHVRNFEQALSDLPVYIADGHHRYETALRYRSDVQNEIRGQQDAAANFVLAYLVESSDPGLFVLGTHRLLKLPRAIGRDEVEETLERWFELQPVTESPDALLGALASEQAGSAFGVWSPRLGLSLLARRQDPAGVPSELAHAHSAAWRRLDLAALHVLGIDQLCPEGTSALSEAGYLRYARTVSEVEVAMADGSADVAFLVRHTPVSQVMAVADAGDLMPEKSTYFYPKPLSGLVLASLEGDLAPRA